MALITSAATGNFSAGATWTGGVVPGVGDEARASTGHTITIDVNTTCDEVSNAGTGIFTLANGVTLTANVTHKSTTNNRNVVQFTSASPAVGTIVGNVTGGTVSGAVAVAFTSTGTLTITGNLLGGSATNAHACTVSSTGTLNLTGNATGGSGTAYGINGTGNSNIFMTGNALGGGGKTSLGLIVAHSTKAVSITGNATGGTNTGASAVYHNGSGLVTITGIATGGTRGGTAGGEINNQATGTVIVKRAVGNAFGPGNTSGLVATPGANNNSSGIIQVEELEFGQYGMSPVQGSGIRLKKVSTNQAIFNFVDAGAAKTLVDATTGQMPAVTDVRTGVSYASGALTGTCAVPAAASVGFGVPVDDTTGTAVVSVSDVATAVWTAASRTITEGGITAADVWSHATRTITGGTVDTLTNAPTVPSASAIAGQVRSELATELANLDAAVSTRATPADIPASDITAIKAKTDLLNTDRLANVATTNIVGTLLSQAHS